MEHSILEKELVPEFIQQISEVIDLMRDNPQASISAATAGQSVPPCSVTKMEGSSDETTGESVGTTVGVNGSLPRGPSPTGLQRELKPEESAEVK